MCCPPAAIIVMGSSNTGGMSNLCKDVWKFLPTMEITLPVSSNENTVNSVLGIWSDKYGLGSEFGLSIVTEDRSYTFEGASPVTAASSALGRAEQFPRPRYASFLEN